MSTKATVAHGPTFHLYQEVLEDQYIYLELESVPFEASYNRVMVPIPVHIWEVIRQYTGVDLSFADQTDDDIRAHVERAVDERIANYQRAETEQQKALLLCLGAIPYGPADTPRDEQIAHGMTHFEALRERQRQIRRAIEELREMDKTPAV